MILLIEKDLLRIQNNWELGCNIMKFPIIRDKEKSLEASKEDK